MRKALLLLLATIMSLGGTAIAYDSVNTGTVLQGTLSAELSSATAQVGDPGHNQRRARRLGRHNRLVIRSRYSGSEGWPRHARTAQFCHLIVFRRRKRAIPSLRLPRASPPGASAGKETTATVVGALFGCPARQIVGPFDWRDDRGRGRWCRYGFLADVEQRSGHRPATGVDGQGVLKDRNPHANESPER